jgi:hypothetical protein
MPTFPQKTSGWAQGIHESSVVQLERIGALRTLDDGRKFRYCRSGAAVTIAKAIEASAVTAADITAQAPPDIAIGAFTFTFVAGGNVTYIENYFQNGFVSFSEGVGLGQILRVEGNAAEVAGTSLPITLAEAPYVAVENATALMTLMANEYCYGITAATITNPVIGVQVVAAGAANVYTWVQTGGPAVCLITGTPQIGSYIIPNATDGSLGVSSMAATSFHAGYVATVAGANGKYYPVVLTID